MTLEEAYQILGLTVNSSLEEAYNKYCELMHDLGQSVGKSAVSGNDNNHDYSYSLTQYWEQAYQTIYHHFSSEEQKNDINYYNTRFIAENWQEILNDKDNSSYYDPVFITYLQDLITRIDETFFEYYQTGRIVNFAEKLKNRIEDVFKNFIICYCMSNNLPYRELTLNNNKKIIIVMGIQFCIDVDVVNNEKEMNLYQIYQKLKKIYEFMDKIESIFSIHLGCRMPINEFLEYCVSEFDCKDTDKGPMCLGKTKLNEIPEFDSFDLDENIDYSYFLNSMFDAFVEIFSEYINNGNGTESDIDIKQLEEKFNAIKLDFMRAYCEYYSLIIKGTDEMGVLVENTNILYSTPLLNLNRVLATVDTPIDEFERKIGKLGLRLLSFKKRKN